MEHHLRTALHDTKTRLKRISLGAATTFWLAGSIAFALLFVIWDHFQKGGVPPLVATAIRSVYLLGTMAWLIVAFLLPFIRQINDLYAARLIERSHPEFRNSLVAALQLTGHTELPGSIRVALAKRAGADVSQVDVTESVSTLLLRQAGGLAGIVMTIFCLYALIAPKPVIPSLKRAFGWSIPAPTRTRLSDITPEDGLSVFRGEPVSFSARITGELPADVSIRFTLDNGKTWLAGQQTKLLAPQDSTNRLWQANKSGVDIQQSMAWQITAGDVTSELRRLTVRLAPEITNVQLQYQYPTYTHLPPASQPGGEIDAIIGTKVKIIATSNVPAQQPVLVIGDAVSEKRRILAQPNSSTPNEISAELTVLNDDVYRLQFHDTSGAANREPIRYPIHARADARPTIRIERPGARTELSTNDELSLAANIDDDFGISRAALLYQRKGDSAAKEIPLTKGEALRLQIDRHVTLSEMHAQPGETIEWWLSAWDNRTDANGQPAYQRTDSDIRHLTIRTPDKSTDNTPEKQDAEDNKEPSPSDASNGNDKAGTSQSPSSAPAKGMQAGKGKPKPGGPSDTPATQPADAKTVEEFAQAHKKELDALAKRLENPTNLRDPKKNASSTSQPVTNGEQNHQPSSQPANNANDKPSTSQPAQAGQDAPRSGKTGNEKDTMPKADGESSKDNQSKKEPGQDIQNKSEDPKGDKPSTPDSSAKQSDMDRKPSDQKTTEPDSQVEDPPRRAKAAPESSEHKEQKDNAKGEGKPKDETSKESQDAKQDGKGKEKEDQDKGKEGQAKTEDKPKDGPSKEVQDAKQEGQDKGKKAQDKDKESKVKGEEDKGKEGQGKDEDKSKESENKGQDGKGKEGQGKGKSDSADKKQQGDKGEPKDGANPNGKPDPLGEGMTPGGGPSGGATPTPPNQAAKPEGNLDRPESPKSQDNIMPPGRVERLMDALDRELRRGKLDETLLDALGWDLPKAQQFVDDYKRIPTKGQKQADRTQLPGHVNEATTPTLGDQRILRAKGPTDPNAKALNATARRASDNTNQLLEAGRQKVTPRYRPLLDAYYRSLASQPGP